jgi:hypothetical protein
MPGLTAAKLATRFPGANFATKPRFGQVQTGFLPSEQSGCNSGMEAAMIVTPELKQAVEKPGGESALIEIPGTHTSYPVDLLIPWRPQPAKSGLLRGFRIYPAHVHLAVRCQSSSFKPGTRLNSAVLAVTSVRLAERA